MTPFPTQAVQLLKMLERTWGFAGIQRRAVYEVQRRAGTVSRQEQRWLSRISSAPLALAPVQPVVLPTGLELQPAHPEVHLYGALEISPEWPASWYEHPFTRRVLPMVHWSQLTEGDPTDGDVKDLWEIGRLTWLGPFLQRAAAGDDAAAEECWSHIESFAQHNPPFFGPQWMCGQESALRGIMLATVASALRHHPLTTEQRLDLVARLLAQTVGRVRPTIGYALSQRNNHAVSEAAFLWTASILVRGLPDALTIRRIGAKALKEAVSDQWYEDGSYAQHSPTYQRLAVHDLLWVLAVSRATGVSAPVGTADAIRRSHDFLVSLMEPTTGQMPNLGGNDGALLFDLSPVPIGDFRPMLSHAAAATCDGTRVPVGPEDVEAGWFGLSSPDPVTSARNATRGVQAHHIHRGSHSHAVLRAGPLRHRPAHADQLHVDLWISGVNVVCDPGSYRYTAEPPWQNALADEEVHNLPRIPGQPQATRRGRFLWTRWADAQIVARIQETDLDATLALLTLPGGAALRRLLVRLGDAYVVADQSSDPSTLVRWNLPRDAAVEPNQEGTAASGCGWQARFHHSGSAHVLSTAEHDPRSGWRAPTYAVRHPVAAIELRVDEAGRATGSFAPKGRLHLPPVPDEALASTTDAKLGHALRRWHDALNHIS